jgi:hypothetical protein
MQHTSIKNNSIKVSQSFNQQSRTMKNIPMCKKGIHEWCTLDICSRDTCSPDICSRDTCSPATLAPQRHLLSRHLLPRDICSPMSIIDRQDNHHLHEGNRVTMLFSFSYFLLITYLISFFYNISN